MGEPAEALPRRTAHRTRADSGLWRGCSPIGGPTARLLSNDRPADRLSDDDELNVHAGIAEKTTLNSILFVIRGQSSTLSRSFDRRDVDLLHRHHRVERPLGFSAAGGHRIGQHARRDLPGETPAVLALAARGLLPTVGDDGVPIAGRWGRGSSAYLSMIKESTSP